MKNDPVAPGVPKKDIGKRLRVATGKVRRLEAENAKLRDQARADLDGFVRLQFQLRGLEITVARLREWVRAHQWSDSFAGMAFPCCPECGADQFTGDGADGKHEPICSVPSLLQGGPVAQGEKP